MSTPGNLAERFWAKVDQGQPEQCWPWSGAAGRNGYGSIYVRRGHRGRAHRISWELTHGEIPDGLWVLHKCDNPPCVNPSHLFLGTRLDNVRDMFAKGRARSPGRFSPGEAHRMAKLTVEQVNEIRQRRAAGEPLKSLSAAYGVAQSTISLVARRKKWQTVA